MMLVNQAGKVYSCGVHGGLNGTAFVAGWWFLVEELAGPELPAALEPGLGP